MSNPRGFGPYQEAYGVEFSPDGSKLYGTCNGNSAGATGRAGASEIQIIKLTSRPRKPRRWAAPANHKIGALQRGPDGKIYVAREDNSFLGHH
ncbi:MAG: hypothetical protein WKG07_04100 [Hymenobacter sp.]